MINPQTIYSDRVDWYADGRPSYPDQVLEQLTPLPAASGPRVVADIGSGTGLLAAVSLRAGHRVFGVEPNPAMRAAAEAALADYDDFVSVAGTAEQTGLPAASIDLITVGQALHWFDLAATRGEFRRIARLPVDVVLVWNEAAADRSAPQAAAEAALTELLPQLRQERGLAQGISALAAEFFDAQPWTQRLVPTQQRVDQRGFLGRYLSNSYSPAPGSEPSERLIAELTEIFARFQQYGQVELCYDTWIVQGQLAASAATGAPR